MHGHACLRQGWEDRVPRLAGSHALLQRLQQEGVEVLLGNPSSAELRLMDALAAGEPWVARGARRALRAAGER